MLAHAQESHVFPFDQVGWSPTGLPDAEMAILWGSEADGTAMWAFRLQPGVAIPPHTHSRDYWGLAVQGRWQPGEHKPGPQARCGSYDRCNWISVLYFPFSEAIPT